MSTKFSWLFYAPGVFLISNLLKIPEDQILPVIRYFSILFCAVLVWYTICEMLYGVYNKYVNK